MAFESLVTGKRIGMDPPNRLNPGPLAARITFFAPVSLLFFLTVMVILGVLRQQSLHPMNYFFLSAAFFAFHLLLAYLVDHIEIHAAFADRRRRQHLPGGELPSDRGGMRTALVQAGLAQLVFLVLFSYAFFFEGYTGLTVTSAPSSRSSSSCSSRRASTGARSSRSDSRTTRCAARGRVAARRCILRAP